MKYARKHTEVEAWRFDPDAVRAGEAIPTWVARAFVAGDLKLEGWGQLIVIAGSGPATAVAGDMVIRGEHDIYPCAAAIFAATYEPVEPAPEPGENTVVLFREERPAFQQRVLDERDELTERFQKLHAFINSPAVDKLDPIDSGLLRLQRVQMAQLLGTLDQRIARF